jgi:hypothetical protein
MSKTAWNQLQDQVARCTSCSTEFPDKNVECPPGKLYPTATDIPDPLQILFVGVAPPRHGEHFYSDPKDRLALGLFKILSELDRPCSNIEEFLGQGFFLTHTAKCPLQGTWKPSKPVSMFCSSRFLTREIQILQPAAVCWLSKNVGYPVATSLVKTWDNKIELEFGQVVPVRVADQQLHVLATVWPGRGREPIARDHLRNLVAAIDKDIVP